MTTLLTIVILAGGVIFDQIVPFLSGLLDGSFLPDAGSGVTFAFALAAGVIAESVLAATRRWHGSIDDQFSNIDNMVGVLQMHPEWGVAPDLLGQLTNNRDRLQTLINKCRTSAASAIDRTERNSLLKLTIGLCLVQVRLWAYGQYSAGMMTADDIHLLGFLLPGEAGGHHARVQETDIKAEVKVSIINEDYIRVVIDQSAGENAAQVMHGWPHGIRNALIVITAADGKTEVHRAITTHLHTDIHMPAGSRGKQFIIKASFLRHVDDSPRFGNEPTFSMPLTTEDLAATLDRQHHEEYEAQLREVERLRQESDQLHAQLDDKQ
jgi:hypothetical protein